jgi:hypothetical protein
MGFVCGTTWFSDWNSGVFCPLTHDNPGAVALPIQSIFCTYESITIIIILYQYGTEYTQFFDDKKFAKYDYASLASLRPEPIFVRSQDRSAGIATGWTAGVRFQKAERFFFCLLHSIQTGSGVHPASCTMGICACFPEGKEVEAWSWPLTPI